MKATIRRERAIHGGRYHCELMGIVRIGSENKMCHYEDHVRSLKGVISERKSLEFYKCLVTNLCILWEPELPRSVLELGTCILSVVQSSCVLWNCPRTIPLLFYWPGLIHEAIPKLQKIGKWILFSEWAICPDKNATATSHDSVSKNESVLQILYRVISWNQTGLLGTLDRNWSGIKAMVLCLCRSIKVHNYIFLHRPALCLLISTHSLRKYWLSIYHRLGLFQSLGLEKGMKQIKTHIPNTFIWAPEVSMSFKFQGPIIFQISCFLFLNSNSFLQD